MNLGFNKRSADCAAAWDGITGPCSDRPRLGGSKIERYLSDENVAKMKGAKATPGCMPVIERNCAVSRAGIAAPETGAVRRNGIIPAKPEKRCTKNSLQLSFSGGCASNNFRQRFGWQLRLS